MNLVPLMPAFYQLHTKKSLAEHSYAITKSITFVYWPASDQKLKKNHMSCTVHLFSWPLKNGQSQPHKHLELILKKRMIFHKYIHANIHTYMYACVSVLFVLVLLFKTLFLYRMLDFYQKRNGILNKKALFVVSSLTPWPVKKP